MMLAIVNNYFYPFIPNMRPLLNICFLCIFSQFVASRPFKSVFHSSGVVNFDSFCLKAFLLDKKFCVTGFFFLRILHISVCCILTFMMFDRM